MDATNDILKRYWGYDSFRPLQPEAIACVLERRDSVVVLPTGGGKSASPAPKEYVQPPTTYPPSNAGQTDRPKSFPIPPQARSPAC